MAQCIRFASITSRRLPNARPYASCIQACTSHHVDWTLPGAPSRITCTSTPTTALHTGWQTTQSGSQPVKKHGWSSSLRLCSSLQSPTEAAALTDPELTRGSNDSSGMSDSSIVATAYHVGKQGKLPSSRRMLLAPATTFSPLLGHSLQPWPGFVEFTLGAHVGAELNMAAAAAAHRGAPQRVPADHCILWAPELQGSPTTLHSNAPVSSVTRYTRAPALAAIQGGAFASYQASLPMFSRCHPHDRGLG